MTTSWRTRDFKSPRQLHWVSRDFSLPPTGWGTDFTWPRRTKRRHSNWHVLNAPLLNNVSDSHPLALMLSHSEGCHHDTSAHLCLCPCGEATPPYPNRHTDAFSSKQKIIRLEIKCERIHKGWRKHYIVFHEWKQSKYTNTSTARCWSCVEEYVNWKS